MPRERWFRECMDTIIKHHILVLLLLIQFFTASLYNHTDPRELQSLMAIHHPSRIPLASCGSGSRISQTFTNAFPVRDQQHLSRFTTAKLDSPYLYLPNASVYSSTILTKHRLTETHYSSSTSTSTSTPWRLHLRITSQTR